MKKHLIFLLSAALLVLATGCEKTSKGHTQIVNYPIITLLGDNPYVIQLGGDYKEPGYTATLEGEDYTSHVTVNSNVNPKIPGIYSVSYSASNSDGYSWTLNRDVYVLNPGGVANVYISNCWNNSGSRNYKNIPIVISPVSDGVYEIEDLLGGYYFAGVYPGYEPTYNFHATVQFSLNEDGTFHVLKIYDWQFKSSFNYSNITGGYNPETGEFKYNFDGINVALTPFEP